MRDERKKNKVMREERGERKEEREKRIKKKKLPFLLCCSLMSNILAFITPYVSDFLVFDASNTKYLAFDILDGKCSKLTLSFAKYTTTTTKICIPN